MEGALITQLNNGKLLQSSCLNFDHIFDETHPTTEVFQTFAKTIIESAMLGFNATIFAYGQTSSGKTYTMLGDKKGPGIIQLAIIQMFDHINKDPCREYLLVVTYMEIYNEVVTDLLNPSNTNLKVKENAKKEVFVGGLTKRPVNGSEQMLNLMLEGKKNRHFGETNMNERSSRSHTIFAIRIESSDRIGPEVGQDSDDVDGAVLVSQLNLVDLAGSERVSLTGAEGLRLREGAHINKSLLTLGSVIANLSEGQSFVPYRDSKLTRILQNSLGGNARTGILCTVTPASLEETAITLKFASRAKIIKNRPSINEVLDDGAMLKKLEKEIRDLRDQLTKDLESEKQKYQQELTKLKANHDKQIQILTASCLTSSRLTEKEGNNTKCSKFAKRRETWCPGAAPMLSINTLESAAALAQSVVSNFDSSEVSLSNHSNITVRKKIRRIKSANDQPSSSQIDLTGGIVRNEVHSINKNVEVEKLQAESKELSERVSEVDELKKDVAQLKDRLVEAESEASRIADLEIDKKALSTKYEELRRTKDQEIAELRRNMQIREEEHGALKVELEKLKKEIIKKEDHRQDEEMSPLTEGNDKGDDIDSSTVEYVVNDEESCITAHENKIHQQTVEDENKQEIECMDQLATMQEGQDFERLQHLLNKSNTHCQFLLKRMEEQREKETKRQENKEITDATEQQQVERRCSRRKENDQVDSQGSTDNSQPEPAVEKRKRTSEDSTSKLSDYITEEAIVKRQKINQSKSLPRTPLHDQSPEQCVPNTPESASPKKGKANTVDGHVHASQPSLMTGGVMRDYQIVGLEWLKLLYENGVNSILADEMGLGKTVQCIGLIAHLIETDVKGPFLITAPVSTLKNWVSEFDRFTPKILTPFLLRRKKSDVGLSLPPKKELLVYAPLTNEQETFYRAALKKSN